MEMLIYLLMLAAVVIMACVLLKGVSDKLGIPVLLAFIALGMLFGTDGFLKIPFENYRFAETICSTALIFIMFYGGFGTKWSEARPAAGKAISLSTIGAVISSTDAASVFSILRSKRLNLKENTASLLEVESGSNDPCSYMLTVLMLTVMSGELSFESTVQMIFSQVFFGIVCGVLIALAAGFAMKHASVPDRVLHSAVFYFIAGFFDTVYFQKTGYD